MRTISAFIFAAAAACLLPPSGAVAHERRGVLRRNRHRADSTAKGKSTGPAKDEMVESHYETLTESLGLTDNPSDEQKALLPMIMHGLDIDQDDSVRAVLGPELLEAFMIPMREHGIVASTYAKTFQLLLNGKSEKAILPATRAKGLVPQFFPAAIANLDKQSGYMDEYLDDIISSSSTLMDGIKNPGKFLYKKAKYTTPVGERALDEKAEFLSDVKVFQDTSYLKLSTDGTKYVAFKDPSDRSKGTEEKPVNFMDISSMEADGAAMTSKEAQESALMIQKAGNEVVRAIAESITGKDKDGNPSTRKSPPPMMMKAAAEAVEAQCTDDSVHKDYLCNSATAFEKLNGIRHPEYYIAVQNAMLRGPLAEVCRRVLEKAEEYFREQLSGAKDQQQNQNENEDEDQDQQQGGDGEEVEEKKDVKLTDEQEQQLARRSAVLQQECAYISAHAQAIFTGKVDGSRIKTDPVFASSPENMQEFMTKKPDDVKAAGGNSRVIAVYSRKLMNEFIKKGKAVSEPKVKSTKKGKESFLDIFTTVVPVDRIKAITDGAIESSKVMFPTLKDKENDVMKQLKSFADQYEMVHSWSRALTRAVMATVVKKVARNRFGKAQARSVFITPTHMVYDKTKKDLTKSIAGSSSSLEQDKVVAAVDSLGEEKKTIEFKKYVPPATEEEKAKANKNKKRRGKCYFKKWEFGSEKQCKGKAKDGQSCLVIHAFCLKSSLFGKDTSGDEELVFVGPQDNIKAISCALALNTAEDPEVWAASVGAQTCKGVKYDQVALGN